LETYSGSAWYRKSFQLTAEQASSVVNLDLGDVAASAEVRVNGELAGVMAAPPWKLDISAFAKPGENRIEVLVCNTLANHYVTIPTHYRGSTLSGLLGPVRIAISK
jgi:Glycosyl hydrolases family 2, sugar binding domain